MFEYFLIGFIGGVLEITLLVLIFKIKNETNYVRYLLKLYRNNLEKVTGDYGCL